MLFIYSKILQKLKAFSVVNIVPSRGKDRQVAIIGIDQEYSVKYINHVDFLARFGNERNLRLEKSKMKNLMAYLKKFDEKEVGEISLRDIRDIY
jgi:hypothetical protein